MFTCVPVNAIGLFQWRTICICLHHKIVIVRPLSLSTAARKAVALHVRPCRFSRQSTVESYEPISLKTSKIESKLSQRTESLHTLKKSSAMHSNLDAAFSSVRC